MPTARQRTARPTAPHPRRNHSIDAAAGSVLRELRLARSLTQEQLAWSTGVERAFISEIERGVKGITLTTLYRLAEGLAVPPHEIIAAVDAVVLQR